MPRRGIDLTDDQWRLVKSHAAKRGQTISEFFADVLVELGMGGYVRPTVRIGGTIDESHMEGDTRVIDKFTVKEASVVRPLKAVATQKIDPAPIRAPGESFSSRPFTPAPKPKVKKP